MPTGHRPCSPRLAGPWPAVAVVPGGSPAARRVRCHVRGGFRRDHYVSVLVVGGRSAAGHPSKGSDRRRHQHGHQVQPVHVCRTPAVRTAVVPEAADGQSAGGSPASGSGSLQLSRPALRAAACGGRPRPAKTRLPYRPSGRFWLLSQSIGKANLKELPHRWQAARDCFSGQMPSVGRQTLILRRNGRRLGPLPL
jgi:hypothetical protein